MQSQNVYRRELKDLLHQTMLYYLDADSSSSESDSSSDEDELVYSAFVELSMMPQAQLGPRLNLDDLSATECEQLFR